VYPGSSSVPGDAGCSRTVANRTGLQCMMKRLILRGFLLIGERARTRKNGAGEANGAQGRNRTTDTAIFSRMLYQLSYLGAARIRSRERRFIVGPDSPVYTASPWTARVRHGPQGGDGPSCAAPGIPA
jgi:hypothetical protein